MEWGSVQIQAASATLTLFKPLTLFRQIAISSLLSGSQATYVVAPPQYR